jgi:hypothetical protein
VPQASESAVDPMFAPCVFLISQQRLLHPCTGRALALVRFGRQEISWPTSLSVPWLPLPEYLWHSFGQNFLAHNSDREGLADAIWRLRVRWYVKHFDAARLNLFISVIYMILGN